MCEFWPKCEVCKNKANQRCAGCSMVYYCDKEHQKQHWKTHKKQCRPYMVKKDENLGKYIVATRTIKFGEVILKEKPAIRGPAQSTGPVCLGCLETIDDSNSIPCEFCGWPVCDKKCQNSPEHQAECEFTVKYRGKVNIYNWLAPHPLYRLITPLRVLCSKDRSKLNTLESHCNLRQETKQWLDDNVYVVQSMKRLFNNHTFEDQEVMRACGILQINGHEVPLSQPPHVALYAGAASLFEHSCIANCTKSFTDENSGEVTIWASRDIECGEHLSICYTDPLWGTEDRCQDLLQNKFFHCGCARCEDPSELGSYTSALYCPKQKCGGYVLPIKTGNKLDEETSIHFEASKNIISNTNINWNSNWKCNSCGDSLSNADVRTILTTVNEDLSILDRQNIDSCKSFLSRNSSRLPIGHYAMLGVQINLAHLIGSGGKDSMKHTNSEDIHFKIDMCERLIQQIKIIAPAEQRLLGSLRFELHSALAEQARRSENIEQREKLLWKSLEAVELCVQSLLKEALCLHEGLIRNQAEKNALDLRKIFCNIR